MAYWSDEPSSPLRQPKPALLSPIERVAEILEALFVKEPELTAKLLGELARCDTAELVKLFGSPSRRHDRTSPAPADVSTVDTLPA